MARQMHKHYKDAGYHTAEWNTPKPNSSILGNYDSDEGGLLIEYLAEGPSTLPEFHLSFENGRSFTVVCEDVAKEYIKQFNAKKHKRKSDMEHVDIDLPFVGWQRIKPAKNE